MHFAFVFQYMDPVYKLIESFQKQTGGPADPLGCLEGVQQQMSPPSNGVWDGRVQKLLGKLSTTQAVQVGSQLKEAAQLMRAKVDNLHAKTIKQQAATQHAIECSNPVLLGTPSMQSHQQLSKFIP